MVLCRLWFQKLLLRPKLSNSWAKVPGQDRSSVFCLAGDKLLPFAHRIRRYKSLLSDGWDASALCSLGSQPHGCLGGGPAFLSPSQLEWFLLLKAVEAGTEKWGHLPAKQPWAGSLLRAGRELALSPPALQPCEQLLSMEIHEPLAFLTAEPLGSI